MGANDFISIENNNGMWEVWIRDVDGGDGYRKRGDFEKKADALAFASTIYDTEYGIVVRVKGRKKPL